MKARDRPAVAVLRATLAAIDNAEAVELPAVAGLAIEASPVGPGTADVPRRELAESDVARIVRRERAELDAARADYLDAGRTGRAEQLHAAAAALRRCAFGE